MYFMFITSSKLVTYDCLDVDKNIDISGRYSNMEYIVVKYRNLIKNDTTFNKLDTYTF